MRSIILIALATVAQALPQSDQTPLLPSRLVYQSENATFFENIAVRSNGHLILTTIGQPSDTQGLIYRLEPQSRNPKPYLLAALPDSTGVTGIAEISPDVFIVNAGLLDLGTLGSAENSTVVWKLDLRNNCVKQTKVAQITGQVLFNGLTAIPGSPDLVLVAESLGGKVWRVNVKTGEYGVVIEDETLTATSRFPLGVNGVHVKNSKLYFTNSARNLVGQVPISKKGEPTGGIEIIASLPDDTPGNNVDDFALDNKGNAWVASHGQPGVFKINKQGKATVVVNRNSTGSPEEPTAAAFGRNGRKQEQTLYVVPAGNIQDGAANPLRGQVVAVDTR